MSSSSSSSSRIAIRQPHPFPPRAFNRRAHPAAVEFLHPGYRDDGQNRLFCLPRVDKCPSPLAAASAAAASSSSSVSGWGVHYLTALTACQILAGNAWDGFLALDPEGQHRVEPSSVDEALTHSRYWFVVPDDQHYAIVPSFQEWRFPRDMPDTWPAPSSLPNAFESHPAPAPAPESESAPGSAHVDDLPSITASRCLVTNSLSSTLAHLIPKAEEKWFSGNLMHRFASSDVYPDVNNGQNLVCLSEELHKRLDRRMYAFVPKGGQYVVHTLLDMVSPALPEFVAAYHNLPVQRLGMTPREYLFARFAANIFMFAKDFLTLGLVTRRVLRNRVDETGKTIVDGPVDMGPAELREAFGGGGSRSASPKKRSRSARGNDPAESAAWPCNNGDDEDAGVRPPWQRMLESDTMWYEENVAPLLEEPRGRTMDRRGDACSSPEDGPRSWSRSKKRRRLDRSPSSSTTPSLIHTSFAADSDVSLAAGGTGVPEHGEEGRGVDNKRQELKLELGLRQEHELYVINDATN